MFLSVPYFLPVTRSFHPFQIRRCLIFELICESTKIYAFQKSRINLLNCLSMFFASEYKLPNSCVLSFLPGRTHVFRIICAQRWEFAISLVLVILYEPVNVETESWNFAACLQIAIEQASLFQYSCLRA